MEREDDRDAERRFVKEADTRDGEEGGRDEET